MEKRLESLLERSQFPKFMNDPYGYNNTSNDTKDKFKPEITLEHRIEFEPQETTTATPDFSDNQMLNETINSTGKQYPNKFQVLFDLWLLDSGNGDNMGKVDWNNLSMSEIPEIIYDDYTLVQKKQTILNTFNVLSKFIEQYVSTDQPGSGSLLRFFNGSTTMQDLVMIANVTDFIQLNGTTDETTSITNSDQKEMEKHGQKVFRKIYTYTEEEITTQ
ncbi:uncharacterized protein LOC122851710 isoform X1 [Aphidius gifuensis]|uniref:uncharacterized protein LOC122851710 isoform X1 n=1 Tax=Aphidius gifuensis TaxID=684658 RepID=UPI001CDC97F3|nr:uncharacterized protein LOC122851710 isoform X1 [Aphidius gifuensis]XP_044007055.1 uncharacterized protein LOC122851710 isoform X1 [Aphidius gifuensis]